MDLNNYELDLTIWNFYPPLDKSARHMSIKDDTNAKMTYDVCSCTYD